MSKMDKPIIVVERDILFRDNYFQGFTSHEDFDFESILLKNLKVMRRGNAEEDPTYKQPIGYALFVNPKTKKVFAYQRSKKAGEEKLHNNWSWGIGGHIDGHEITEDNPIKSSMMREGTQEEITIHGNIIGEPKIIGYINDDSDAVGKVHFGVLHLFEIDGHVEQKDEEIFIGEMKTIEELQEIINSENCVVEGWSKIAIDPLRKYFEKL